MQTDWLQRVEVFFGDANNAEARVYARLAKEGVPADVRLTGRVVGPICAYAQTLSASIRLNPKRTSRQHGAEAASAPLSEAIIPDPCFWSPESPYLYKVEVELRRADALLGSTERMMGIRPLGARQGRLVLEGRPWVMRAARRAGMPASELAAWREADLAMLVERPDDELCADASRRGVFLAARVSPQVDLAAELERLARWPCIAIAVCEAGAQAGESTRTAAPNLVLAERFVAGVEKAAADWADVVVCEDDDVERLARRAALCVKPVLALRPEKHDDPAAARRACDRLQRELAGRGEFAGYIT